MSRRSSATSVSVTMEAARSLVTSRMKVATSRASPGSRSAAAVPMAAMAARSLSLAKTMPLALSVEDHERHVRTASRITGAPEGIGEDRLQADVALRVERPDREQVVGVAAQDDATRQARVVGA